MRKLVPIAVVIGALFGSLHTAHAESIEQAVPAAGHLSARVIAEERVGVIDGAKTFPIGIELSADPHAWTITDRTRAQIEVFSGTDPVAGCSGDSLLPIPSLMAPGETLRAQVLLPCALPKSGQYSIVATIVAGARDEQTAASDESPLEVDTELAAHTTGRVPLARVEPSSMAHPPVAGAAGADDDRAPLV